MTQQDKLMKIIKNNLMAIENNLEAYKKVNATLSEKTLFNVATYLDMTNQILEKGFIDDACDEVQSQLIVN